MIERLIFDVDNTLITNVDFVAAIEDTLKQIGMYSGQNVGGFIEGINTYEGAYDNYNPVDYVRHIGEKIGVDLPDNFLDVFFERLKSAIPEKNSELIATIKKLSEKYELVLLTNYFSKSQLNRLNNMGIGQYFSECYGEKLIKPNLEAYIMACGNNQPEECVMIGDSVFLDVEQPKRAGLKAILVNTKNVPTDDVDAVVVNKVEDINAELIESLR